MLIFKERVAPVVSNSQLEAFALAPWVHMCMHVYIYIHDVYIYMYIYACICVCIQAELFCFITEDSKHLEDAGKMILAVFAYFFG